MITQQGVCVKFMVAKLLQSHNYFDKEFTTYGGSLYCIFLNKHGNVCA